MQFVGIMIKRAFWTIFLCLALISFPQPSLAVTVRDVPNPQEQYIKGWVTDMANLLDPNTKFKLNQMLSKLEHQNGTEIAVVTVPNTASSASPKQFATQLFNYWGIGKKGINNGVLFLISKSDHRVEIETGKMIESILPNARVREIINTEIIPRFKQDEFANGILAATQSLVLALEEFDILSSVSKHQPNLQPWIGMSVVFGIIGVVVVWAIYGIVQALKGDDDNKRRRRGSDSSYSSDIDDTHSRGGDSGSFSGGGSGGGGDGGSW